MSAEENKAVIRRLFEEVYNGHDFDLLDELVAEDVVNHVVPIVLPLASRSMTSAVAPQALKRTTTAPWGQRRIGTSGSERAGRQARSFGSLRAVMSFRSTPHGL